MVKISERKTQRDWAYFLEEIAAQYEKAEKITLVMDNLNRQTRGSFYETFQPGRKRGTDEKLHPAQPK